MSKRNAIDEAKAALAQAKADAAKEAEHLAKVIDRIAKRTHAAFLTACKQAKVDAGDIGSIVVKADGATFRTSGDGASKSPSLSRQAGVTSWVVDGKDIGSPLVSRMLAAVYNVDRPKDVYGADSPERHARKPKTLTDIKAHNVKAVVDGKRIAASTVLA